jgi:hypothetical protein
LHRESGTEQKKGSVSALAAALAVAPQPLTPLCDFERLQPLKTLGV